MEHLNLKLLLRTLYVISVLFFAFQASAIDTKRFDSPPLARGEYLAFTKPITLSYGTTALPVDRRKLIMPPSVVVVTTTVKEETKSASAPVQGDFPLLPYQDANSSSSPPPTAESYGNMPMVAPPASLPLSDPFQETNSFGVDSTDELLEVFESSTMSPPRSRMQGIPFVPPYTIAPDNMRVTSKATYQRRQR